MSAEPRGQTVVGIGAATQLQGYSLAGVVVRAADTPESVLTAWEALPAETQLVLLTSTAAGVLGERITDPHGPLTAVLPDHRTTPTGAFS